MSIGAFAERTRLSAKALRLYDRLGLLSPVLINPANGCRFHSEEHSWVTGATGAIGAPG
jgi:DNA-binding transcriptional MerR regulator